jgi:hypothetical protein
MKAVHLAAAAALGLALAAAPAAGLAADPTPPPATSTAALPAIDPAAVEALRKMSAYLSSLSGFELTSKTSLDLVTVDGQKLTFDGTAKYKARKPDGLVLEVQSDLKNRDYYYDGKTFTVFAPELGYYATVPAPATIRETLDTLYKKFGIELPLDDLFRWSEPGGARAERLTSGFDVGSATIEGVDTEQYAFREGDIDWQIWIAQGDKPLPMKLAIVDRTDPALPAYVARLSWNTNPTFAADDFTFRPPGNAKSIKLGLASK